MRKIVAFSLLFGFALAFGFPASILAAASAANEHEHEHGGAPGAGGEVTIKGELVDSLCYVGMAAKGAGHKQCAMDCAKAGIPISIVEEGTGKMYTVLPKQDKTGYPDSVISKMGEKVTLKGDFYENGGNKYVTVESVE
ncbi:MAG: hypothetical protein Q7J69_05430 [Candidatus Omnitrophota bacterium]|nr:hypothetical protein [Candidatus Omnitrophota bacterium]